MIRLNVYRVKYHQVTVSRGPGVRDTDQQTGISGEITELVCARNHQEASAMVVQELAPPPASVSMIGQPTRRDFHDVGDVRTSPMVGQPESVRLHETDSRFPADSRYPVAGFDGPEQRISSHPINFADRRVQNSGYAQNDSRNSTEGDSRYGRRVDGGGFTDGRDQNNVRVPDNAPRFRTFNKIVSIGNVLQDVMCAGEGQHANESEEEYNARVHSGSPRLAGETDEAYTARVRSEAPIHRDTDETAEHYNARMRQGVEFPVGRENERRVAQRQINFADRRVHSDTRVDARYPTNVGERNQTYNGPQRRTANHPINFADRRKGAYPIR
jgi:hypothetical protein